MLPRQLRVGDFVDDYCPRERRLTDHAIVAMVEDEVRQVRCSACDAEHEYRQGKVPSSRKKKPAPPLPPPGSAAAAPAPPPVADEDQPAAAASPAAAPVQTAPEPESTGEAEEPGDQQPKAADGPFHRRLIRAQLPRIEGADPTPRPIPEFTMHRPPAPAHRHGRPFRPGQPGGGQHRPGGKGPGGPRQGHGGGRHGQGQGGHADGNTFGNRGGRGGGHAGQGGQHGPRPARHGFGQRPPRGPKKH